MNLKTGRKPFGIAFRMLLLMVVFISLIFSAIFISFNFFIGDYVERDMTNQLENAVNDIIQNRESILAEVPYRQIRGTVLVNPRDLYVAVVKYLRNKNEHSEVNTVIYSPADYTRYFPDSEDGIIQSINNLNEIDELINIISENIWTEENIIYRTPALPGDYYFTSVDLSSLYYLNGFYALFYVNSGKYDDFTSDIYFMLLIILLVAMIFTILYVTFISRSISKPLRKLCSFADEIGRGNFSRSEYSFKDRELIDLNERMNQTAAKLEKNDEDRKIFFQNVSHELKTPLMSVRGYAEGIKYKIFEDGKELDSAVNIIISESERLDNLVSDLLYVSKIDSSDFIS
ncbi:MAG: HAMP domain-containing histidine kinase, partial [Oscillospiraceae bacterium]|nr:HAMP domain-containing histidine kinase [Oscillospiraceae bacterium]